MSMFMYVGKMESNHHTAPAIHYFPVCMSALCIYDGHDNRERLMLADRKSMKQAH